MKPKVSRRRRRPPRSTASWDNWITCAVPLIVIAQIHQCRGELQKAQDAYREALALAEKTGEPQLLLPCYDGLATIYLDRGDSVRAEQFMEKARELCERTGPRS